MPVQAMLTQLLSSLLQWFFITSGYTCSSMLLGVIQIMCMQLAKCILDLMIRFMLDLKFMGTCTHTNGCDFSMQLIKWLMV